MSKLGPKALQIRALREARTADVTNRRVTALNLKELTEATSASKPKNPPPVKASADPKETNVETQTQETPVKRKTSKTTKSASRKAVKGKTKSKAPKKAAAPKTERATKTAAIGELLTRKEGCTTKEILSVTGWPSVSVPQQAKALGLQLRKEKPEGGGPSRYYGKAA